MPNRLSTYCKIKERSFAVLRMTKLAGSSLDYTIFRIYNYIIKARRMHYDSTCYRRCARRGHFRFFIHQNLFEI